MREYSINVLIVRYDTWWLIIVLYQFFYCVRNYPTTEQLKTTVNIFYSSHFLWGRNLERISGQFWFRVFCEVAVKMSGRIADMWKLGQEDLPPWVTRKAIEFVLVLGRETTVSLYMDLSSGLWVPTVMLWVSLQHDSWVPQEQSIQEKGRQKAQCTYN